MVSFCFLFFFFFFFKQKTAYDMRISDWSSDVCSSDLDFSRSACRIAHGIAQCKGRTRQFGADKIEVIELILAERRTKIDDCGRLRAVGEPRRLVIDAGAPIGRHPPPGLADLEPDGKLSQFEKADEEGSRPKPEAGRAGEEG